MNKSRITRWILLVLAVAGLGYYGWQRFHGEDRRQRQTMRKKRHPQCGARHRCARRESRLSGLSDRALEPFRPSIPSSFAPASMARSTRSLSRKASTSNRATCSPRSIPGRIRRRSTQAKAKKEQDEANLANINLDLQRFIKLGEFATRQQLDTQRSSVSAIDGPDRGRRSRHRQRPDPARLYRHQGADLRRRRPAPGRCRQHRQCLDPDRDRLDHADRADCRDFHRAGRAVTRHQGRARRYRRSRPSRSRPTARDRWRKERWRW